MAATRFVEVLRETLAGTELASLAPFGGIDQFLDNTDVLTEPSAARAATAALHPSVAPDPVR
jgi:hypothetical protein